MALSSSGRTVVSQSTNEGSIPSSVNRVNAVLGLHGSNPKFPTFYGELLFRERFILINSCHSIFCRMTERFTSITKGREPWCNSRLHES